MGRFIAGAVAVLVGGGLAFASVSGVVNVVSSDPKTPGMSVMDYGTNR